MDASYNDDHQTHVTDALNPEVIVPIHWDDFFVPLKKVSNPVACWKDGSRGWM